VLGDRERAAEADARRLRADSERVARDVELEAATAFLMLEERRAMARLLPEQLALAQQAAAAASARYVAATGAQADVLRAEIEVARLGAALQSIEPALAAAEAMLNASLGRDPAADVPPLEAPDVTGEPPSTAEVTRAARGRAELDAGRAEVARAHAEVSAMDAMYAPMGMVRAGPAYTMAEGWGAMLMLGVSIPIWRDKLNAGVAEAEAMVEMARADLVAMTRMIEGEASAARQEVLAARARYLALRAEVLPRARQLVEPALASYAAGTLPLVSVIESLRALRDVQGELVEAQLELGLAWARLQRAQGGFPRGARK
jgi:outer membrane protein TolC